MDRGSLGSIATFSTANGAGAVALIASGACAVGIALVGRWPSKVVISGNEVVWQEIRETVDSQIEIAGEDEEGRMVLAELKTLKERLEILQRTGRVAEHPAAAYDKEILAALARVLPSAEIIAEQSRSREIADFVVRQADRTVLVESKWRAADEGPFRGSTLGRLTANIDPEDRLLVVSNSADVIAHRNLDGLIGARGRVVNWRSPSDDAERARTLNSLFAN